MTPAACPAPFQLHALHHLLRRCLRCCRLSGGVVADLNVQNYGSNFDEDWPFLYAIEPTAFEAVHEDDGRALSAQEREASVQGVEACLWAQWVNAGNFEPRFWPRVRDDPSGPTFTALADFDVPIHVECVEKGRMPKDYYLPVQF